MPPSKTSHARHRSFPDASLLDDARPDNNPGPQPWERDLTLAEGVVWMIADEAGLDGRALAEAGIHNMDTAQPVLRLPRAATQAPSAAQRRRLAQRTAAELNSLDPKTRSALAEPVQARIAALMSEAEARPSPEGGRPSPEHLASVNPATGLQEFAAMPTDLPKRDLGHFYRPRKDWWEALLPFPLPGPITTQPYPGAETNSPSLLPKPSPPDSGGGLLPKPDTAPLPAPPIDPSVMKNLGQTLSASGDESPSGIPGGIPGAIGGGIPSGSQGGGLLPPPASPGGGLLGPAPQNLSPAQSAADGFTPSPVGQLGKTAPLPERHPRELGIEIANIAPTGGLERNDTAGSGAFWSSRVGSDGKKRKHYGLDITVEKPGDPIVSPIDGIIKRRRLVYKDDPENPHPNYDLVEIEGTGRHKRLSAKVMYVDRNGLADGTHVVGGDSVLGTYQDLHRRHDPKMSHHVHLETKLDGYTVDPAYFLPNWRLKKP